MEIKTENTNRAFLNHYLDSRCRLMVTIVEMMSRATCCKKIILNEKKCVKARF